MSLMISSLLRKAWLIIVVTAAVGAGTWVLTGAGEDAADQVTATSRVGITTVAQWPFYDVVLEQGRIMIDEPDFAPALEAELGLPITSIRTVIPDKLSVFDIEVVSDTAEHAVALADAAAQEVVDRDADVQNQEKLDSIAALDLELTDLDTRIAELQAEMTQQTAQITDIAALQAIEFDPVREEEKYPISLERDLNQFVLTDLVRERATKLSQRSNLTAAVTSDPRYQVLRLAELPEESNSPRVAITFAAALAALLVSCAIAVALDRRTGNVHSAWQLRSVCGAESAGEIAARGGGLQRSGAVADRLHRALDENRRVIGLIDATGRGLDLHQLAPQMADHGLTTTFVDTPHSVPGNDISFVDVSDEYAASDVPRPRSHGCDAVMLFVDSRTAVKDATSLIERTGTSPGLLAAVLVKSR